MPNRRPPDPVALPRELAAELCARHGLSGVAGALWAHLLLAPGPVSLDELVDATGAAKSTVSVSVRRLEAAGLARRVWQPGDRRDHYVGSGSPAALGRLLRQGWLDGGEALLRASAEAATTPEVRARVERLAGALAQLRQAFDALED